MTKLLLQMMGTALSLWQSTEKRKYYDEWKKLKDEYYKEDNKPQGKRDMAVLDNIDHKLQLLGQDFNSAVKKQDAGSSS